MLSQLHSQDQGQATYEDFILEDICMTKGNPDTTQPLRGQSSSVQEVT